jgi:undecaprenyl-phosphate 4-deoxy-4-formamido-L-arabinose transferase
MKEISVVIPIYNGRENLVELMLQMKKALHAVDYEVILVNDGSTDDSWNVVRELCKTDATVIGINLRKNFGQDNAIMAGLSRAEGGYIVVMDDDLQHSPFDIIKLYGKCREGYDVCYAYFRKKKQRWWKNIGSRLNGWMAVVLLHKPRHIYLSPFQIMRREVAREILNYKGPYPYIQGLLFQITDNVAQITVEHHERAKGKGNFTIVRSAAVFLKHVTSFSVVPLRISSVVGFAAALVGFCLSVYYTISYFILRNVVEGWTTLIIAILILGGLILMSIGLIGEYLGRLYLSVNDKPAYSIKEIVNGNRPSSTDSAA